jgi:hypothetical protein
MDAEHVLVSWLKHTLSVSRLMLLVLLIGTSHAYAHQQKAGVTNIVLNPRTQVLEVMHRLYMHDAEHAVKHLWSKDADIIASRETQTKFAEYVASRFGLYDKNEQAYALKLVGFEVEGRFFWVYQEMPLPTDLTELTVRHQVLQDIWSAQQNLVNIDVPINGANVNGASADGQTTTHSMQFTDKVDVLSVRF